VLRDALQADGDQVLEHHSNLDPDRITPWNKLASENWDAPLIVTTTVQLYESLFAARTSACRKLHNIAGSVIVLDEAQSLPLDLLEPTLAALAELVRNYKCTVILCTATQPAIGHGPDFKIGLENVREVMEDPADLAQALRRVEISDAGELDEISLAQRMAQTSQVLTIVDTRARAANLFKQLRDDRVEAMHLSAAMCPMHRSAVLREVRDRLQQNQPCRVVSTQLIEAGVDVDFPVVYRALAGLDAIAQAAGRCNREGREHRGQVHIFHYKGGVTAVPKGHQRQAAHAASQLIGLVDDLLSPDAQKRYFKFLYWDQSKRWDHEEVMPCFKDPAGLLFDYRSAADRYKLIKHEQKPVFIPWDEEGESLLQKILNPHEPLRMQDYRLIQRYQVQIPTGHWLRLKAMGEIEDIPDRVAVLLSTTRYDKDFGLRLEDVVPLSPEDSVI
jgi:CRISPR-associated endonuclease/helicase Cas3